MATPKETIEGSAKTLENAAATLRSLTEPWPAHHPAERLTRVRNVLRRLREVSEDLETLARYWPESSREA